MTMKSWKQQRKSSTENLFQKRNYSRIMIRNSSKVDVFNFDKSLKNLRDVRFNNPNICEQNKHKIKLSRKMFEEMEQLKLQDYSFETSLSQYSSTVQLRTKTQ